eukprot:m.216572 g.216572  ORF g.216572 m.216572 type:complete len:345 (-) comp25654_c0_seq1:71-1105(-)
MYPTPLTAMVRVPTSAVLAAAGTHWSSRATASFTADCVTNFRTPRVMWNAADSVNISGARPLPSSVARSWKAGREISKSFPSSGMHRKCVGRVERTDDSMRTSIRVYADSTPRASLPVTHTERETSPCFGILTLVLVSASNFFRFAPLVPISLPMLSVGTSIVAVNPPLVVGWIKSGMAAPASCGCRPSPEAVPMGLVAVARCAESPGDLRYPACVIGRKRWVVHTGPEVHSAVSHEISKDWQMAEFSGQLCYMEHGGFECSESPQPTSLHLDQQGAAWMIERVGVEAQEWWWMDARHDWTRSPLRLPTTTTPGDSTASMLASGAGHACPAIFAGCLGRACFEV